MHHEQKPPGRSRRFALSRSGRPASRWWDKLVHTPNSGLLLLLLLLFCSCNVKKYLNEERGERLVSKNSLELKGEKGLRLATRSALATELDGLYKQEPNERALYLFRTRLWLYYKYRDRNTRYARWIINRVAEPPAIYNDSLAQITARSMENNVRNRGYFQAKATYFTKYKGRYKAKTKYTVHLGPLYQVNSVTYTSRDTAVLAVLRETVNDAEIKAGGPLDGRLFDAEKLRITSELRNRGYAFFTPNFIDFLGDSTGTRADVTVEVLRSNDSTNHRRYTVGRVDVFSSLVPDYSSMRQDTTIGGIYFATSDPEFQVNPRRLYESISIRPGELYRQENFDATARKLNSLGLFRFVTIRPYQDSLQPNRLNVEILFSPNQRLTLGGDVDLNSASASALSGRLFGVSASGLFRNRNLFHGAELLQSTVQYSVEFDIENLDQPIYSQDFNFRNELGIPRFFDYFGIWRGLHNLRLGNTRIVGNSLYGRLQREGQARIGLTYNYLDINNLYVYNLFNGTFGYDIRSNPRHQYSFDHVGIDILQPRFRPLFEELVANNEFLRLSFGNQLFTGFLLRSFSYTYSGAPNRYGEHWFARVSSEVSGLEELVVNRLWGKAFGEQTWDIGGLEFSKFLRFDADASYTRELARGFVLANRLGVGLARPFGDTRSVPYVKQFFVGGPSSIRAWRIRELGPGGYPPDPAAQAAPTFYQASDFRLEFNSELRFPLFWFLRGAIFLDGGNVWSLDPDDPRKDARLTWQSYKNIALGTGAGVRGDFGFFVIRFDAGLKLRYPYRFNDPDHGNGVDTGRYWKYNKWSQLRFNDLNFNLAIGYPF